MDSDKKWTLSLGAEYKKDELSPELNIKNDIDENSKFEISVSKEKIYAEYEIKF